MVFESLGHFQVRFTHRQLHLEGPVHDREGAVTQFDIRSVVLEPAGIHFRTMSVWRNVATFPGAKCQTDGRGTARGRVDHLTVKPHLLSLENLY